MSSHDLPLGCPIRDLALVRDKALAHDQLVTLDIDRVPRAIGDIAGHQSATDAGFQLMLQEPLQGSGAVNGIVAVAGDEVTRLTGAAQIDIAVGQAVAQLGSA